MQVKRRQATANEHHDAANNQKPPGNLIQRASPVDEASPIDQDQYSAEQAKDGRRGALPPQLAYPKLKRTRGVQSSRFSKRSHRTLR